MLQIISPHSFILVSIWPDFSSLAFHFAIDKFSFVLGVVWPYHHTITYDVVLMEFSVINFAGICKVVLALPFKLTINEVTLIVVSIKLKSSFSSLFGFNKVTLILNGSVVPSLNSFTMILIILPFSLVH